MLARRPRAFLATSLLVALSIATPTATLAANAEAQWLPQARTNAVLPSTTRAQLYAVLDRYLAALKTRDPLKVEWATQVRNTAFTLQRSWCAELSNQQAISSHG